MARDQPGLRRRARSLAKRLEQKKPIDRALPGLKEQVEKSAARRQQRLDNRPGVSYPEQLPVSQKREDIAEQVAQHQVIIVCGETGSGKTTQLPKICLELGRGSAGMIGHTQPRRIAARSVATRVAEELQVPLGQGVGFKVRFSDHSHQEGYIKLMTDGILLAEIQSDPDLRQYDTLIIDEAHERSLNIDFLLGYLSQLLPRRPDLKIIITSATIDPERFSKHFNDAPIIMVSGRSFPVEVRYRRERDAILDLGPNCEVDYDVAKRSLAIHDGQSHFENNGDAAWSAAAGVLQLKVDGKSAIHLTIGSSEVGELALLSGSATCQEE